MSHLIPLNRSERAYAALEDVAGSVAQVYELTFERALDPARLRAALRSLVAAYPRTRTRLLAGPLRTRLAVLDDEDPLLDALFDEAFSVVLGVAGDEERLHSYRNALLAEPFALGRSLPVRFRLAQHHTRPTLFIIVHHLVCDGRGMIQMIDALLGALAGTPIAAVPLDPPFMRTALWPRGFVARVRSALRDLRRMRQERTAARRVTLIDPLSPLPAFTAQRVLRHTLSLPVEQLVATARAHETSLTALTLAALTMVLARRAGAAGSEGTREVAVRISVDLRPYFDPPRPSAFGNFVASFMVRCSHFTEHGRLLGDIAAQLKEGTRRFREHERGFGLLLDELGTWIGRRLYASAARRLKARGRLAPMSAHYSTVGSVDHLARHDVGLAEIAGYAPNTGLFVTSMGFRHQLHMGFIYPCGALSEEEARTLAHELDDALVSLGAQPRALELGAPRPVAMQEGPAPSPSGAGVLVASG